MVAAAIVVIISYILALVESNLYMGFAAKIAMKDKRYETTQEDFDNAKAAYKGKNDLRHELSEKDIRRAKWIRKLRLLFFVLFILSFLFVN